MENKGSIWALHCFTTTTGTRELFAPRVKAFPTRSRGFLPNFEFQLIHGTATADLEQVIALLAPLENSVAATVHFRGPFSLQPRVPPTLPLRARNTRYNGSRHVKTAYQASVYSMPARNLAMDQRRYGETAQGHARGALNLTDAGIPLTYALIKRGPHTRFHRVRDRIRQGHIIVTWIAGADNLADFFTKPLPLHRQI
eukprot:gene9168-11774_t